jgi:hypothetical protein
MVGVPAKQRSELDRRQQEALGPISGRYVGVQATYRAMLRELGSSDGESHE